MFQIWQKRFKRDFWRHTFSCLVLAVSMFVFGGQGSAQPMQMKFSTFTGPAHLLHPVFDKFCKDLTDASKGKVVVKLFEAETLGKSAEHLEITREGLADFAWFCCTYTPAEFPLNLVTELPFFSTSGRASSKVALELLKRNLINSEYKNVKLVAPGITAPAQVFSNKKIEKVDDFKGIRVTGFGPIWAKTWSLLGATSISMGYADVYLGLERGTLDAAATSWGASKGWKWQEVTKYPTDISMMGGWNCGVIMNPNSWIKVPADVQSAWGPIFENLAMGISGAFDDTDEIGKKAWKDAGREIISFPAKEREKLAEKLIPVWREWIDKNEAAGKPAKRIYQTYAETMKKIGEPVVIKIPGIYKD